MTALTQEYSSDKVAKRVNGLRRPFLEGCLFVVGSVRHLTDVLKQSAKDEWYGDIRAIRDWIHNYRLLSHAIMQAKRFVCREYGDAPFDQLVYVQDGLSGYFSNVRAAIAAVTSESASGDVLGSIRNVSASALEGGVSLLVEIQSGLYQALGDRAPKTKSEWSRVVDRTFSVIATDPDAFPSDDFVDYTVQTASSDASLAVKLLNGHLDVATCTNWVDTLSDLVLDACLALRAFYHCVYFVAAVRPDSWVWDYRASCIHCHDSVSNMGARITQKLNAATGPCNTVAATQQLLEKALKSIGERSSRLTSTWDPRSFWERALKPSPGQHTSLNVQSVGKP